MWIELPEAVKMYARYCERRYGVAACQKVRERADELRRKGDLRGQQIWNDVAREIERPTVTPASPKTAK